MSRKRSRENNISSKVILPEFNSVLYLTKKNKTESEVAKEKNIYVTTLKSKTFDFRLIDRINDLENKIKLADEKILTLQNENLLYNKRLYEIYSFLGIPITPFHNNIKSYIS